MLLSSIMITPSLFITAISVVSLMLLINLAYSEIKGNHLKYSKFWNINSEKSATKVEVKVSSRIGMLLLYTPAFIAGLASFWLFPDEGFRFFLLSSALTFHFFKRVLEVLFIHKYSGGMMLDSVILISVLYFSCTAIMVYCQHLSQGLPEPTVDLKIFGMILFWMGVSGNFYHHYLLSKMRKDGEKQYKIPKGGLFGKVVCPHYLFEMLAFWGISLISQTLYGFCAAIGVTFYLTARGYVTRRWYLSKFDNFPQDVKAVFPFLF